MLETSKQRRFLDYDNYWGWRWSFMMMTVERFFKRWIQGSRGDFLITMT